MNGRTDINDMPMRTAHTTGGSCGVDGKLASPRWLVLMLHWRRWLYCWCRRNKDTEDQRRAYGRRGVERERRPSGRRYSGLGSTQRQESTARTHPTGRGKVA